MNFQKTFSLSFSPGVAGTSHHVFSPVNSELLSDQGAAQSILRPFFAQSLVCGKQSLNILKLNKLKWILTVADNFNCSALLGTRGEDFPASFVATGPCRCQWSRRGPGVCPFRSDPSRPLTCISPHSRSFCWRTLVGLRSEPLGILRSRRGSEGSCWYQAPVWGWTPGVP